MSPPIAIEPMVEVNGLVKSFGANTVINGIDLKVRPGEVVVMIGAGGSGKTTLLRCINALETPEQGRIFVGGEPMGIHHKSGRFEAFPDRQLSAKRANIGVVFQRSNLFPHMTSDGTVHCGGRSTAGQHCHPETPEGHVSEERHRGIPRGVPILL
jgi:polar amino acid transport system ATP-binding protein